MIDEEFEFNLSFDSNDSNYDLDYSAPKEEAVGHETSCHKTPDKLEISLNDSIDSLDLEFKFDDIYNSPPAEPRGTI